MKRILLAVVLILIPTVAEAGLVRRVLKRGKDLAEKGVAAARVLRGCR